ncbi:MAG: hypothetical protein HKN26_03750 [Acidimicrobiales bacterium]|nr:hypothetical protein [Acidimicrobiales bacterium]
MVLLGAGAYAVDLGYTWQTRRHLITTTDAAALAAAQEYVESGLSTAGGRQADACNGSNGAQEYVDKHIPDADMTQCQVTLEGPFDPDTLPPGFITVNATENINYFFGPAIGVNGTRVSAFTSVSWKNPSSVYGGLRPFGLCLATLENFDPFPSIGDGIDYTIIFDKDNDEDCGVDAAGNWSVLDFDGGSNPQGEIDCWTQYGYGDEQCPFGGPVGVGDWVFGNTGAFNNPLNSELAYLRNNVDCFGLPVFDEIRNPVGELAEFHIERFVSVKLIDYKVNGDPANRFLTIQFVDCVVQGDGDDSSNPLSPKIIGICAVNGTDTSGC